LTPLSVMPRKTFPQDLPAQDLPAVIAKEA
jgi:hypothetical protein